MEISRPAIIRWRFFCIVVSSASLVLVFHRIHPEILVQVLRNANPWWYLAAVAAYGSLFLPAAKRWQLVMRLAGVHVRFSAVLRATLVGHLFYIVFMGAVGGDLARSAYYSSRFRCATPVLLATAPLDRLLGSTGLLLFAGVAAALTFRSPPSLGWQAPWVVWPSWWVLALVILVAFAALAFGRGLWGKFIRPAFSSFVQNLRRLLASPEALFRGTSYGFLVQLLLSTTLALNIQSVAGTGVQWSELLWTLPIISAFGALPITVAGFGTRELAALTLLASHGISGHEAVAAAVLTLSVNLLWGCVGAFLFVLDGGIPGSKPAENLADITPSPEKPL